MSSPAKIKRAAAFYKITGGDPTIVAILEDYAADTALIEYYKVKWLDQREKPKRYKNNLRQIKGNK